jgi:uncharacterized protein YraI/Cu/Zn superoxide dismutase
MLQLFTRQRWLRIVSLTLLIVLAMSWLPARSMAWSPGTVQIINKNGVVMGTATFTPTAFGQTQVSLHVEGFDPIGGDRALAITDVGYCAPPDFRSYAGSVEVELPSVQFYPDGSADYSRTVTIPSDAFNGTDGSALLLHADTPLGSDVIACGVIVPTGSPPIVYPPGPTPTPPAPPSYSCPTTPPAVPTTTVVAPAGLKLRTGAGLTYAVILTLANGETVYPVSDLVSNQGISWVQVRVFRGGACYEGWVSATYLARWAGTTPVSGEWRVTASAGLRLRSGPGTGYAIMRIVPLGTRLGYTGVEQAGGGHTWVKVRLNGSEFWCAKEYLERIS